MVIGLFSYSVHKILKIVVKLKKDKIKIDFK